MVQNPRLAKSIADAAWSAFFTHLVWKAEEAARQVVKVNPAYTSQTCSVCGTIQVMPLSVRVYECGTCSLILDRDHKASWNILQQAVDDTAASLQKLPACSRGESSHLQ